MKVYITGLGGISAIGNTVGEMAECLLGSRTGIAPIAFLDTRFMGEYVAGEVKLTNEQLVRLAGISEKNLPRTTLLAIIAVREAMKSSGCLDQNNKRTAFLSSTTVGGMDNTENHFGNFLNGTNKINFIDPHQSGHHAEIIRNLFQFGSNISTITTACSSSANAIILGTRLIKSGLCDRVVAGGTDALCKYTLNGFNSLMLLDKEQCKPFDKTRKGINLGEAAAYVVLESEHSVKKAGKKYWGCISGYGIANDAFHQTAISSNGLGVSKVMNLALKTAGLKSTQVDYINAHGTGTQNNDLTEGIAIKEVFNREMPCFSSTKSFTGHTLAAAGALEVIISSLAIHHKAIFPNLNYFNPIEEHGLLPATEVLKNVPVKNVLTNSIGMGGFCASLIISHN